LARAPVSKTGLGCNLDNARHSEWRNSVVFGRRSSLSSHGLYRRHLNLGGKFGGKHRRAARSMPALEAQVLELVLLAALVETVLPHDV
jgi:hypothetical protein